MNYLGYQLKINGLKLPCPDGFNANIIENGSYRYGKERRVINDWQDANGKFHHETYKDPKSTISFTIRERSQEQQLMLLPLFESNENIEVEYWDDTIQEYRTGLFYMEDVEAIASISTKERIYYGSIDINLTEY